MVKYPSILLLVLSTMALSQGCMISHDLYYCTKSQVIQDEKQLRIVDGYNLVLASVLTDGTYDPPVEKYFFLEFNGTYPPLKIEHKIDGSTLKGYLLIRQGDKVWTTDKIAGTVSLMRRTREQILAYVDVAANIRFSEEDNHVRREDFGPTYIYRRAVDDIRDESLDDFEAFR